MKRTASRFVHALASASAGAVSCVRLAGAQETTARIPAEPPISGTLWTVIVPLGLFLVALAATIGLYRRFSRD